ncbi:uncharacterized protein B0I36DRAFT_209982, partial [Microdochium trichocladiopsis]
ALWCATAVAIVFSIFRFYVRVFMLRAYSYDDHVYSIALLPLIISTAMLTFSTSYNWGTAYDDSPPPFPGMASPQLVSTIAQGVLALGSALAKVSVGMFQLRFVTARWQRASIYLWMLAVLSLAVAVNVATYTSCTPAAYFWDTTITDGTCAFDFLRLFFGLIVTWIIVDFYYAILPWVYVRRLNMPHKEKVIVLSSMSLGILASGVGIARAVVLMRLKPSDDTNTDIHPFVLDTSEYAITMICVCIPVCNPLWISWARKLFSSCSRRNR